MQAMANSRPPSKLGVFRERVIGHLLGLVDFESAKIAVEYGMKGLVNMTDDELFAELEEYVDTTEIHPSDATDNLYLTVKALLEK